MSAEDGFSQGSGSCVTVGRVSSGQSRKRAVLFCDRTVGRFFLANSALHCQVVVEEFAIHTYIQLQPMAIMITNNDSKN